MSVKEKLLNELLSGETIGGAALSRELGVSRNAVWKAARELSAAGYLIETAAGGYKLVGGNVLSETAIRRFMKNDCFVNVRFEAESTNDVARVFVGQGKTGVIVADGQSLGRGRFKRKFYAPHGVGAYFSVILRPDISLTEAQLLTAYTAVVTAKAVENLSGGEVKIKWVNDLYMGGKKICGILTEASVGIEGNNLDYAVVGIGINVFKTARPDEISDVATSIEENTGKKIDRNELIANITDALLNIENEIKSKEFMNEYRIMSNIIDCKVLVNNDYLAYVRGIDDDGGILLETENGIRKMNGGEVTLKLK